MLQILRSGAQNKLIKFTLFGLLVMAGFGLILTDVGGFFRSGGISSRDVANIGGEKISINEFDGNLRRSLGRLGIQPAEAYKLGFVEQFLGGEIRSRLMVQAAQQNGIEVGQKLVADQVRSMIAPMVTEGQKAEDVLKQILMNQGMSEAALSDAIRREMTGGLLSSTIQAGFSAVSPDIVRDLYRAEQEKRDVSYIVFSDKAAEKDVQAPNETELRTLYNGIKENFAIPETRTLQLIRVSDDHLKKTITLSDEELRQYYESNEGNYSVPAMRRIEQSIFPTDKEAKSVYDLVVKKTPMEKAVKKITGQPVAYLGKQDIEDAKILEAIRETVVKGKAGEVLPPIQSPLGWHVIAVDKIIPAGVRPFDDVKSEIQKELYDSRLNDVREDLAASMDDLFASGADMAEIKKTEGVTVIDLPAMNAGGQNEKGENVLKSYELESKYILDNGFATEAGQVSPMTEIEGGKFITVRVNDVKPKDYKSFDSVKSDLTKKWIADQARVENRARAAAFVEEIQSGKATLETISSKSDGGVRNTKAAGRQDTVQSPLNPASLNAFFQAVQGRAFSFETDNGIAIGMVSDVTRPNTIDEKSAAFKKFQQSLEQDIQNEAMSVYLDSISRKIKTVVNRDLLTKVYDRKTDAP